jgi:hypothetical protein
MNATPEGLNTRPDSAQESPRRKVRDTDAVWTGGPIPLPRWCQPTPQRKRPRYVIDDLCPADVGVIL